jgi:Nucleotide-sugar transporter
MQNNNTNNSSNEIINPSGFMPQQEQHQQQQQHFDSGGGGVEVGGVATGELDVNGLHYTSMWNSSIDYHSDNRNGYTNGYVGQQQGLHYIIQIDSSLDDTNQQPRQRHATILTTSNNSDNNYDDNPTVKIGLLVLLAVLHITLYILCYYTPRANILLLNDWFIIIVQLGVIFLSCIGEYYYSGNASTIQTVQETIKRHCFYNITDTFHAAIPAICDCILYAFFRYLTFPNFSIITYCQTHEEKLVITAIVSCLLLKNRYYKIRQWLFLFLLSISIAWFADSIIYFFLTLLDDNATYFTIIWISSIHAISSVYFEKLAKADIDYYKNRKKQQMAIDKNNYNDSINLYSSAPPSFWIRNMQVIFYRLLIKIMFTLVFRIIRKILNGRTPPSGSAMKHNEASFMFRSFLFMFMFTLISLISVTYAAILRCADLVFYGITTGIINAFALMDIKFNIHFLGARICVYTCTYCFNYPIPESLILRIQRIVPALHLYHRIYYF